MAGMNSTSTTKREDAAIRRAMRILESRIREPGITYTSPDSVRQYLTFKLARLEREVFKVLFLDTRHRLIADEDMFLGSIAEASVHPREVAKRALQHNAAAVIVAHNHPSGVTEPSQADERITHRLRDALALLDIRLLDHFIIGGAVAVSLAEIGIFLEHTHAPRAKMEDEKPKRRRSKAA